MINKLKKEMRKRTLTQARKYCWDKQSEYVRRLEEGVCCTCGKIDEWKNMQAGHYRHKDCLDFNLKNIHCQCSRCNKWLTGNSKKYAIYLEKRYGFGIIQELDHLADQIKIFKVPELENLAKDYDKKTKELD